MTRAEYRRALERIVKSDGSREGEREKERLIDASIRYVGEAKTRKGETWS